MARSRCESRSDNQEIQPLRYRIPITSLSSPLSLCVFSPFPAILTGPAGPVTGHTGQPITARQTKGRYPALGLTCKSQHGASPDRACHNGYK